MIDSPELALCRWLAPGFQVRQKNTSTSEPRFFPFKAGVNHPFHAAKGQARGGVSNFLGCDDTPLGSVGLIIANDQAQAGANFEEPGDRQDLNEFCGVLETLPQETLWHMKEEINDGSEYGYTAQQRNCD